MRKIGASKQGYLWEKRGYIYLLLGPEAKGITGVAQVHQISAENSHVLPLFFLRIYIILLQGYLAPYIDILYYIDTLKDV